MRRYSHALSDLLSDFSLNNSQTQHGVKERSGILGLRGFVNDQAGDAGCLLKGIRPGVNVRAHHQMHGAEWACPESRVEGQVCPRRPASSITLASWHDCRFDVERLPARPFCAII
jgi:hypothetical protein